MADLEFTRILGGVFLLVLFLYVVATLNAQWVAMEKDLRLAFAIIFFVWILNWARANLGSPRLAILIAIVVAYLTFFKHPQLIWWVIGAILLTTFGKSFLDKISPGKPEKVDLVEAMKHMNIVVNLAPPPEYDYTMLPERGGKK